MYNCVVALIRKLEPVQMKRLIVLLILLCTVPLHTYGEDSDYQEVSPYQFIKHNLYEKDGELYIKSYRATRDGMEEIYIKRFFYADSDRSLDRKLADVIDKDTWERVNGVFYRDKNRLYCFRRGTGGGFLIPYEGVDPDSLQFFTEKGRKTIEEVREMSSSKSSRTHGTVTIQIGDANTYYLYATDGTRVYYLCDTVDGADVKTFALVEGFAGRDANHTYMGGDRE